MTAQEVISIIQKEIERRREFPITDIKKLRLSRGEAYGLRDGCLLELLSFLSDLEKSAKATSLKDAMKKLDEKIALVKHRGTWDRVNVDKYMDEVRGREPEKPMVQDELEKEIKTQVYNLFFDLDGIAIAGATAYATVDDMAYIARHFAKWGAEHASGSSEIPNDLEEAADKHIRMVVDAAGHPGWDWTTQDIADAFIVGYNLCKKQMMEEAVEKTVGQLERQWGGNIHFMHGFEVDEMDFPFLNSQECGYGDKVRIIVLKENGNDE